VLILICARGAHSTTLIGYPFQFPAVLILPYSKLNFFKFVHRCNKIYIICNVI
jgi:hypothetical protein